MPKVDSSILSKKDKILSDIEKIIDPKNVLSHTDEIRPYETDALAAYKQAPLLVVLPETVKESLIFCSRFEDGAWVKGRTFEENKEKVLMLEVSIRYKLCFSQHFL